jgi:hypothetical protein
MSTYYYKPRSTAGEIFFREAELQKNIEIIIAEFPGYGLAVKAHSGGTFLSSVPFWLKRSSCKTTPHDSLVSHPEDSIRTPRFDNVRQSTINLCSLNIVKVRITVPTNIYKK